MIGRFAILLVAISLARAAAWGQEADSAEVFLRNLYQPYNTGKAVNPAGALAPSIFEPGLLALIRRDQALAHGEIGKLDHDPICNCQDYEALTALTIAVALESHKTARAKVSFLNGIEPFTVEFQLLRVNGKWRIYDIRERYIPSLRKFLQSEAAQ